MTINFGICNDSDESLVETYDCYQCPGCDAGESCLSPKTFKSSRWTMNVANGNASMLLAALGLESDDCGGSVNANVLLKALSRTSVDLLVRGGSHDGNMYHCGVDAARAGRYLAKLLEIAEEAAKREELVGWG